MNKQLHPAVFTGTVIAAVVLLVFIFIRMTSGPGHIPPGGVGNAGPFERGIVGKGGGEGKTRQNPPTRNGPR
jgi:hypothetical protein